MFHNDVLFGCLPLLMEKINKLFDEVKDIDECYEKYRAYTLQTARMETEVRNIEEEVERIDLEGLKTEIKKTEEEYQKSFADIDRLALNNLECYSLSDMRTVLSRVDELDVLKAKTLAFFESLFYTASLGYEDAKRVLNLELVRKISKNTYNSKIIVFTVSKEAEELFGLLVEHPEIQRECYDLFKSRFSEDIQGVLPNELRLYQDEASLYFVFQSMSMSNWLDEFHREKDIDFLGLENFSHYKTLSHIVFKALRENLKAGVIKRSLSDEEVEENNAFFNGTDFYINSIPEWKLDVVMKEIIDMTRKQKNTEIEKVENGSEKIPPNISMDYKRFLSCFELLRRSKSKRYEKGARVVDRAILKLFDHKRYDVSVYNYFLAFADITHFMKICPGYTFATELYKRKENLFFEAVRESSRVKLGLEEPLMMLKLYFKEKHLDFIENLNLFVPMINQEFFEIQFFEFINEEVIEKIQGFKASKRYGNSDIASLIDYILDLSFHISAGAIKNLDRIKAYRMVLSMNKDEFLDYYANGKLQMPHSEILSLCCAAFRNPEDRDFLLNRISK